MFGVTLPTLECRGIIADQVHTDVAVFHSSPAQQGFYNKENSYHWGGGGVSSQNCYIQSSISLSLSMPIDTISSDTIPVYNVFVRKEEHLFRPGIILTKYSQIRRYE